MSDDDLERRLGSALRTGVGAGEVDLGPVVRGARTRAERTRRRRVAVAGAAVAMVVAVPVGAVAWTTLGPDADRPSEADVATQPTPTQPTPTQPTPTQPLPTPPSRPGRPAAVPAPEVDTSRLGPAENAYEIPESVLLRPADLPVPVVELARSTYRDTPAVPGQACGGAPGLEPAAGLSQQLAEENSDDFDQLSVSLQVTGWSRGDGAAAFAEVRDGTGRCRWLDPVDRGVDRVTAGRPELTLTRTNGGLRFWVGVVQIEDVLVAVEVAGPVEGGTDRAALPLQLAHAVADRLVAAGAVGSAR